MRMRMYLLGYLATMALQEILVPRMPLMAMSQMHSPPTMLSKPRLYKNILDLWQQEWGEYPQTMYFWILLKLNDIILPSCCSSRREETVLSRLHSGHSYQTRSFELKGDKPLVCMPCDELLWSNFIALFRSDWRSSELFFSANIFKVLFRNVPQESNVFNALLISGNNTF